MIRQGLLTFALAALLSTGTAFAKIHVYVGVAPPAPIVQTPPPAPAPGYVWIPGHYIWNGSRYIWRGGAWAMPPAHHHRYVAGVWVHGRRGYYFRPGYWR